LVSPVTPFQTVIGATSPGGEVSARASLPLHLLLPVERNFPTVRSTAVGHFAKPHLRSGAVCIFSRLRVALFAFLTIEIGGVKLSFSEIFPSRFRDLAQLICIRFCREKMPFWTAFKSLFQL
jgi:hypothetical protein